MRLVFPLAPHDRPLRPLRSLGLGRGFARYSTAVSNLQSDRATVGRSILWNPDSNWVAVVWGLGARLDPGSLSGCLPEPGQAAFARQQIRKCVRDATSIL
jgi:hypothetical protein